MAQYRLLTERELLERLTLYGAGRIEGESITRGLTWAEAVTATTLWTPPTNGKWVVSQMVITNSSATNPVLVTVFDDQDDANHWLFKGTLAANTTVVVPFQIPRIAEQIDDTLKVTSAGTEPAGSITVYGWEIGGNITSTSTSISTSSSSISTSSISTSSSSVSTSSSSSSTSSQSTSSSSSSSISTTSISISSSSSSSSSISTSSSSQSTTSVT